MSEKDGFPLITVSDALIYYEAPVPSTHVCVRVCDSVHVCLI